MIITILQIITTLLLIYLIKIIIDMVKSYTSLYSDKYSLVYRIFPDIKKNIEFLKIYFYYLGVVICLSIIICVLFIII